MIQKLLASFIRICLRLLYKRVQVSGMNNLYDLGPPGILVANHQNALLDALLIVTIIKPRPYFLTRADAFVNDFVSRILTWLQMVPVYRERDGFSALRDNVKMQKTGENILARNNYLTVFGEGNHCDQYHVRILKRGFAQLAFRTKWNLPDLNLSVIPIGIQYSNHRNIGSCILINIGQPINIDKNLIELYSKDSRHAEQLLMDRVGNSLKELVLHIEPLDDYPQIQKAWRANGSKNPDLRLRLEEDRQWLSQQSRKRGRLKSNTSWAYLLLRIINWINFFIPALLYYFSSVLLKDKVWTGSFRFLILSGLGPLVLCIQTAVLHSQFSFWPLTITYPLLSLALIRMMVVTSTE